ncbi:unnamed protein product [Durusdinium trenchii]|uniref:Uncharacterized protein n=1 Tax=Durusdinium trenchii TaxID=1381693 RepID=A0ABP0QLF9_9DINO
MIQNLVTYNQQIGVLTIPPPILSRVYQTLSRGFVNLLNAKKIADTRFPFPWAQIITMLIVSYCISTPLVVSAIIKQFAWAMLVTFIPVFSIIALNIVCAQLEMPFGSDANDLPLQHFQERHQWGKVSWHRVAFYIRRFMAESCVCVHETLFAYGRSCVLLFYIHLGRRHVAPVMLLVCPSWDCWLNPV